MVPTVSVLMGKKLLISYPSSEEINYVYNLCHVFAHVLVCFSLPADVRWGSVGEK